MKKEIFALVLLGALFAAGLFNTQYLKDFTGGIGEELALSRAYCENGEYELSLEHARRDIHPPFGDRRGKRRLLRAHRSAGV